MSTTPDRFPGDREEDKIRLNPQAGESTVDVGDMIYSDDRFKFRDANGEFDPRSSAASGLLVICSNGTLIYDSNGDVQLKAVS